MAAALSQFDASTVRSASFAGGSVAVAAPRIEHSLYSDAHLLAAVYGRPRFSNSELSQLADRHGVAQALAQGYAQHGADLLPALSGSFALAILDGERGQALLAIDRMGANPLFYEVLDGALVFGSSLRAIGAFPGVSHAVNRQAIYDYLYFHMVPAPQSIYTARRRLLPGSYVLWTKGGVQTAEYWSMRFVENDRRPFPELKRTFLSLLRKSVSNAATDGATGAFLSGGTDSSTIAGMLGETTGQPARTYSIGFEAEGYDEMSYARIAARHFRAEHHEYYVSPQDVVSAIPRIAEVHDQPFGNSSAVPTYYCAKLAKEDGIERLLGGDGGDELFGGNARYAKQHLYAVYSELPASVRKTVIEPLAFALPEAMPLFGKAQRYIRNAKQAMPARYDNYNLLERFGPANVLTAEFLSSVDPQLPQALREQAYHGAHAGTLINKMLALDLRFQLADDDLPKVSRSSELAGVEVSFPMLDDDLVEFSATLAPELKLKGTQLRYFFKQALKDFLPPQIIRKQKHGFGLPFGPWLQSHKPLEQIALDSLTDLKRRLIIRPEFIDELTSTHVRSHAEYFGTMVWILMMLEQWFRLHRVSLR